MTNIFHEIQISLWKQKPSPWITQFSSYAANVFVIKRVVLELWDREIIIKKIHTCVCSMDILKNFLLHRFIVKNVGQIWKHSKAWTSVERCRGARVMKDIQPEEFFRVLQVLNMFKFEKTRNYHLSDEQFIVKYFCTWYTFPDLIIC